MDQLQCFQACITRECAFPSKTTRSVRADIDLHRSMAAKQVQASLRSRRSTIGKSASRVRFDAAERRHLLLRFSDISESALHLVMRQHQGSAEN